MTTILGVKLDNRSKSAGKLQEILTEFGCVIKTRIGLHPVHDEKCTPVGIILLEVVDDETAKELEVKLCEIENTEIQKMLFK